MTESWQYLSETDYILYTTQMALMIWWSKSFKQTLRMTIRPNYLIIYLGRQTETCCHPRCTLHRRLSAGMYPCGIHSLAENCKEQESISYKYNSVTYSNQEIQQLLDSYSSSVWSSGNLLRHLLCADTTALSMGKTGASTSALLSLKNRELIRKVNIKLVNNT